MPGHLERGFNAHGQDADLIEHAPTIEALARGLSRRRTAALRTGDWCKAVQYSDSALHSLYSQYLQMHSVSINMRRIEGNRGWAPDSDAFVKAVDSGPGSSEWNAVRW